VSDVSCWLKVVPLQETLPTAFPYVFLTVMRRILGLQVWFSGRDLKRRVSAVTVGVAVMRFAVVRAVPRFGSTRLRVRC
jgi:hypothetical protein